MSKRRTLNDRIDDKLNSRMAKIYDGGEPKPVEIKRRSSIFLFLNSLIRQDGEVKVQGRLRVSPMIPGKNGLNGRDGIDGQSTNGIDGQNGTDGVDGKDGRPGVPGIMLTYNASTSRQQTRPYLNGLNLVPIPGPKGNDGVDGTNGIDGINGTDGVDGINGVDGRDGERGPRGIPQLMSPLTTVGECVSRDLVRILKMGGQKCIDPIWICISDNSYYSDAFGTKVPVLGSIEVVGEVLTRKFACVYPMAERMTPTYSHNYAAGYPTHYGQTFLRKWDEFGPSREEYGADFPTNDWLMDEPPNLQLSYYTRDKFQFLNVVNAKYDDNTFKQQDLDCSSKRPVIFTTDGVKQMAYMWGELWFDYEVGNQSFDYNSYEEAVNAYPFTPGIMVSEVICTINTGPIFGYYTTEVHPDVVMRETLVTTCLQHVKYLNIGKCVMKDVLIPLVITSNRFRVSPGFLTYRFRRHCPSNAQYNCDIPFDPYTSNKDKLNPLLPVYDPGMINQGTPTMNVPKLDLFENMVNSVKRMQSDQVEMMEALVTVQAWNAPTMPLTLPTAYSPSVLNEGLFTPGMLASDEVCSIPDGVPYSDVSARENVTNQLGDTTVGTCYEFMYKGDTVMRNGKTVKSAVRVFASELKSQFDIELVTDFDYNSGWYRSSWKSNDTGMIDFFNMYIDGMVAPLSY